MKQDMFLNSTFYGGGGQEDLTLGNTDFVAHALFNFLLDIFVLSYLLREASLNVAPRGHPIGLSGG